MIYERLLKEIFAFTKNNDFKVHVIQGATTQLCLMTTKHPDYDLDTMQLKNSYSGKNKDYDKYIAKLKLISKKDATFWDKVNTLNSVWYKYVEIENISYRFTLLNRVIKSDEMDPVFLKLLERK